MQAAAAVLVVVGEVLGDQLQALIAACYPVRVVGVCRAQPALAAERSVARAVVDDDVLGRPVAVGVIPWASEGQPDVGVQPVSHSLSVSIGINCCPTGSTARSACSRVTIPSASITLDRRLLDAAFSLEFLAKHEHMLLVGPASVGKSFLAQALGYSAVRAGHTVRYYFRRMNPGPG